eukprot:TRINITY_DN20743_c0_g1_i1.p1 TRINITY_DN20743_c0_g1~~TRINITY_DN20743_c0_g1_i1.p1  ORF type:complete len:912 (+),score=392.20 TRINITY_DN20743_c0_g1_i1:167-2737(+)
MSSSMSVVAEPPLELIDEAIRGLEVSQSDKSIVARYLKVLQVVVWKKRGDGGKWVEADKEEQDSDRLDNAWRSALTVAVSTEGKNVCRLCTLLTETNPFCSLTGEKHPHLDPHHLRYKRTYILPGRVSELFSGRERNSLAKIMSANIHHLEVCIFCMMVITQMTSPKLAVEANKKELLDSGVLPVIIETVRKYEAVEVIAQDACAVLRNLLTNIPTQQAYERFDGPRQLIKVVDKYPLNNELVHRACGCLLILTSKGVESRRHLFDSGLVKSLCTILDTPYGRDHMVRRLVISIMQKLVKTVPQQLFKEEMTRHHGFTLLSGLYNATRDDDRDGMKAVLNVRGDLPRGTFVDPNVIVIDEKGALHNESFVQLQKSNANRNYELDPPTPKMGPKVPTDLPLTAAASPLFPSPCSFASVDDDDEDSENAPWDLSASLRNGIQKARTPGSQAPVQSTLTDVALADDDLTVYTSDHITTPSTLQQIESDAAYLNNFLSGSARSQKTKKLARDVLALLDKEFTAKGTFPRSEEVVRKLHDATLQMSAEVVTLLQPEPKLIDLEAPVYVFGDIHGNFGDLQYFMKRLMIFDSLDFSPYSFLFVGDYVDRGRWGPEVVAYLFALKLLAPRDVIMLRGNHEDVMVNGDSELYGEQSFRVQCQRCYGPTMGAQKAGKLFDTINSAFKHFPIAAVINNKVFASHGGIPRFTGGTDNRLDVLRDPAFEAFDDFVLPYNLDMSNPRTRQHVFAHDCIWSDPSMKDEHVNEFGFGDSSRGGQVVSYGQHAIHSFLDSTGMEFIIRGHEEKMDGLNVSKQARVMTVFSTSDYCRKGNKAGVALVRKLQNGDLVCRMIHRAKPSDQVSAYA